MIFARYSSVFFSGMYVCAYKIEEQITHRMSDAKDFDNDTEDVGELPIMDLSDQICMWEIYDKKDLCRKMSEIIAIS